MLHTIHMSIRSTVFIYNCILPLVRRRRIYVGQQISNWGGSSGTISRRRIRRNAPELARDEGRALKAIVDIASPLGISVHDHIIAGKNGHASLKGMRLI
jgi:hypothetical protein